MISKELFVIWALSIAVCLVAAIIGVVGAAKVDTLRCPEASNFWLQRYPCEWGNPGITLLIGLAPFPVLNTWLACAWITWMGRTWLAMGFEFDEHN